MRIEDCRHAGFIQSLFIIRCFAYLCLHIKIMTEKQAIMNIALTDVLVRNISRILLYSWRGTACGAITLIFHACQYRCLDFVLEAYLFASFVMLSLQDLCSKRFMLKSVMAINFSLCEMVVDRVEISLSITWCLLVILTLSGFRRKVTVRHWRHSSSGAKVVVANFWSSYNPSSTTYTMLDGICYLSSTWNDAEIHDLRSLRRYRGCLEVVSM